jgi:hypothetical protein
MAVAQDVWTKEMAATEEGGHSIEPCAVTHIFIDEP